MRGVGWRAASFQRSVGGACLRGVPRKHATRPPDRNYPTTRPTLRKKPAHLLKQKLRSRVLLKELSAVGCRLSAVGEGAVSFKRLAGESCLRGRTAKARDSARNRAKKVNSNARAKCINTHSGRTCVAHLDRLHTRNARAGVFHA